MRRRRRSWFDRPRWWVDYLLFAVTTAAAMWALRWLGAPAVSWDQVAFLSVLMPIGPTWLYQRAHRAWEQLERSTPATRAELDAAAEVVLRRRSSTGPTVLREAVRVADLARRELGSPTVGLVTTSLVASVLVVVAAVTQALWPLPVAAVGLLLTARAAWRARLLERRQAELRTELAAIGVKEDELVDDDYDGPGDHIGARSSSA